MPQTTPERRARWGSDKAAIEYLEGQGYVLLQNWTWVTPQRTSAREEDAILYLMDEWDFGGIVTAETLKADWITLRDVEIGLRNLGIDPKCPQCPSIFFTGSASGPCTCGEGDKPDGQVGPVAAEEEG